VKFFAEAVGSTLSIRCFNVSSTSLRIKYAGHTDICYSITWWSHMLTHQKFAQVLPCFAVTNTVDRIQDCSTLSGTRIHHKDLVSNIVLYRGADKSLARPGRKQATATEGFHVHIFYL
jgi:hypothetical protein